MAILETSEGSIEVRIHKDPLAEDTDYYPEHVKLSERQVKVAVTTDRYIPCLVNETYGFEIRLKEGFDFGDYTVVRARFQSAIHKKVIKAVDHARPPNHEGGIKEDLVFHIRTASAKVDGQTIRDAHFAFKGLTVENTGHDSVEEVEAVEIDPNICVGLKITVLLCGWTRRALTEAEVNLKEAARARRAKGFRPNKAEKRGRPKKDEDEEQTRMASDGKVKEEIYKKEGLGFTMGFVGGKAIKKKSQRPRVQKPEPVRDYVQSRSESAPVVFTFHIRTAEFLSSNPLYAIYPALLEFHHWVTLSVPEQKVALRNLQEYHQLYTHNDREKRAGQILPRMFHFKDFRLDDPREWRPWDKLSQAERRPAFETLQKFKRAAERAKVLKAMEEAVPDELIDLEQFSAKVKHSEVELGYNTRHGTSASRTCRRSPPTVDLQDVRKVKSEPTDVTTTAPTDVADKEPVDTPIFVPAEQQLQRPVVEETAVCSVIYDELELNEPEQLKASSELNGLGVMKNEERDEQISPPKKKAKMELASPKPLTFFNSAAFPFDIDSDEEQLEENARDIEQEIEEAKHLAELRKKKAAVKARLETVKSQKYRRSISFSSPNGSIVRGRDLP